ncbi:MAG: hypothetical protein C5B50_12645, partial [Verrucomicrobia bacterium]
DMHTAKNLKGLWPECLFIYARLYSFCPRNKNESAGMPRTPNASRHSKRLVPREAFGVRRIPPLSFSGAKEPNTPLKRFCRP